MEVSAVPSNTSYPEGGDYGNRAPNMSYAAAGNDSRGDYCAPAPRYQNQEYPPRQYVPQEGGYVASQVPCSHCEAHCCQRLVQYQSPPAGSRGERVERYASADEYVQTHASPNQPAECSSDPQEQPVDRASSTQDTPNTAHLSNDPSCYQTTNGTPPISSACIESPFIAEERNAVPTPLNPLSVPNIDPTPATPPPTPAQSMQAVAPPCSATESESVASLMAGQQPSSLRTSQEYQPQTFNPSSLTHLNFKEKQLAMSAVKKAAANMNCVNMFQDKDKAKTGKIGRRDFQIVMDRIGVLRGLSSREIDAVFKGFATQTDTEMDYKKFSAACRHAIDSDHRLARMMQK